MITLFLIVLAPLARADGVVSIAQAESQFAAAIAAHQADIASFLALPCVSTSATKKITGLQKGTEATRTTTSSEYKDYMAFVTRTMEGSGHCDGGFQGVATESGLRKQRSQQSRQHMAQIEEKFKAQAMANLFAPPIIYSDSVGKDCSDEASRLYDKLEAGAKKVDDTIQQMQLSFTYEEAMFNQFQARNDALRVRCGDTPEDGNRIIHSAAAEGMGRAPASMDAGEAQNPLGDITGTKEDAEKRAQAYVPRAP